MNTVTHSNGHDGIIPVQRAPELSDLALFAFAVLGVWWLRRRLRARFARKD